MKSISWKYNEIGNLVAFEGEMALSSFRNPKSEATKWASQRNLEKTEDLVVIGLGSGYHIHELLKIKKFNSLAVIESSEELIQAFEKNFPHDFEKVQFYLQKNTLVEERLFQYLSDRLPTVLAFRPAWGTRHLQFEDLFAKMTFRNLQMIRQFLSDSGLGSNVRTEKMNESKNLVHLKNIYENLQESSSEFGVSVQLLRELWV